MGPAMVVESGRKKGFHIAFGLDWILMSKIQPVDARNTWPRLKCGQLRSERQKNVLTICYVSMLYRTALMLKIYLFCEKKRKKRESDQVMLKGRDMLFVVFK